MRLHFRKLKKNLLVKVGSFNAIGVMITSVCALISSKVIALFLGAEGMALIGNLRNVLQSLQSIGTLGLYNGIVKYVAEHKNNEKELVPLLSTAYFICFVVTMCLSAWLYFNPFFWNNLVFGEAYNFSYIFRAIGLALPFYGANALSIAIINGFSKYKVYTILTVLSTVIGLVITILLIMEYDLKGAFYAIVITPAISLFFTLVIIFNQKNFAKFLLADAISWGYIKRLGNYSIMALITATVLPTILIKIRNFIIETGGTSEAGYWEAMQRISHQYMAFITTLLTLYMLPKLSSLKRTREFRKEVLNFYKIILPLFLVLFVIIYIFRNLIIQLLFSDEFLTMEPLFSWQLAGDFFRIMALVISYQLIAKKMFWPFIFTEGISLLFRYYISIYLIHQYGFVGASIGYCATYIFYFILMIFVFHKSLFGPDRNFEMS